MIVMSSDYQVLGAADVGELHDEGRDFAYDVLLGLSGVPKRLSSKYFYDEAGSALFREIMELPEYYLTRAEQSILERYAGEILRRVGEEPIDLVDLGAGDGAKTRILLDALGSHGVDATYVPIDISETAMAQLTTTLAAELPELSIEGLVSDYVDGVHWLGRHRAERRRVVLFLGSNIGNFDHPHARAFLQRLWSALRPGDYALIGFDLKKDIDRLLAAYCDSRGVTARFNLNLLHRINDRLGGDFELEAFRHYGTYNVFSGAMESYLVSQKRQSVWIEALHQRFEFDPWEPVHTEFSYKYLRTDIERLARETGFHIEAEYLDEEGYFVDSLWRVEKSERS